MSEAGSLTQFVEAMGGERSLRVEENLGDGFVRLRVAEAERRQAKHDIRCIEDVVIEMLRNSRDAGASRVFVATTKDGNTRSLVVLDDGDGIPFHLQDKIFDARVTSKLDSIHVDKWGVHGRGMALFSVSENTESAMVMDSAPGHGAAIRVISRVSDLSERADQSTWPTVGKDEDGLLSVNRGPHNMIRTCCEFALEERDGVDVYIGSPAEIAATIRRRVRPSVKGSDLLFIDDLSELPVLERFSAASDAQELLAVCKKLGLEMSERTAHRIMAGQIKPVRSVLSRLNHTGSKDVGEVDLMRDRRGLKLSEADLKELSRMVERDFAQVAERYYLTQLSSPRIRVSRDKITISIAIDERD